MQRLLFILLLITAAATGQSRASIAFGNGIKIGEVTHDSAVIWTRITEPITTTPSPSLAGRPGQVRIQWWPLGAVGIRASTGWAPVDPNADFTHPFNLGGLLRSATTYELLIEGRTTPTSSVAVSLRGKFKTAPSATKVASAHFTVITGQAYARRDDPAGGHRIYKPMLALDPDFFVHTGDVLYYDKPNPYAKTQALARLKWNRMYALPLQRDFHNQVASWFMKDDHDTLKNDCWPGQSYGQLTWKQGLKIFREQTPAGPSPYRRLRWGTDLEVWFVEGRDYRSSNKEEDGPQKTIWGSEQKAWFYRTFAKSKATFRVLISPTPIVGPDRSNKRDNHSNQPFATEGREIRHFIGQQKNAYIICGDRHWQYVSRDPGTGIREYSCGPTTDTHAGGFSEKQRTPAHKYLKVCGGFLSVRVERKSQGPSITFRHHDTSGAVIHEDRHLTTH